VDGLTFILPIAIFAVAALYASVGHGGASGYIAVLSLTALSPAEISTTALVLNILVAGIALISFARAGHLSMRRTWPFLLGSVPAAFAGGLIRVPDHTYYILVAVVLIVAAIRLVLPVLTTQDNLASSAPRNSTAISLGAGIGLLSGIVGVGGGIFLSPLMMLKRWAAAKQTAATAACFVTINSVAGLLGRLSSGSLDMGNIGFWPVIALAGGLLGSHLGARRFPTPVIRTALAAVLMIAAVKLAMNSGV
jgi:hypothetical protein